VTNLLSNATKFTPKGGDIVLKARKKGNDLVIQVQDDGIGIPKEEQKRLFEPYYRAKLGQDEHRGLGLGLTLCKQLVELHKGKIWVESEGGKGNTFSFSLPLANSKSVKSKNQNAKSGSTKVVRSRESVELLASGYCILTSREE
jgi:signal transduction histidine kinase